MPALSSTSSSSPFTRWITQEMRGHKNKVWALEWSCDGKRLASGSTDQTVRIWQPDRSDYKTSTSLRGHQHRVMALTWDPANPERLASVSEDKTLKIWDIRQGKAIQTIDIPPGPLHAEWSPDGKYIVVGNKANTATIIDVEKAQIVNSHTDSDEANEMVFGRTSQHLAVASSVGLKIFAFPSMKLMKHIDAHPAACASVDLDPRGRYLAIGSNDSLASLWDTMNWICVRTFSYQDSAIRIVRFSHDGDYLALVSEEAWIDIVGTEGPNSYLKHIDLNGHLPNVIAWNPVKLSLAYVTDESATPKDTKEGVIRVFSPDR